MPLISTLQLEAYAVIKNKRIPNTILADFPQVWRNIKQNILSLTSRYTSEDIGRFASSEVIKSMDPEFKNQWVFIGAIRANRRKVINIYWESNNISQYLLPYVLEAGNEELANEFIDKVGEGGSVTLHGHALCKSMTLAMQYGFDSVITKIHSNLIDNSDFINWALMSKNERYIEKYKEDSIKPINVGHTFRCAVKSGLAKWAQYYYERGTTHGSWLNGTEWCAFVIADSVKYLPEITASLMETWYEQFDKVTLACEAVKMNNVNLFKQMIASGARDYRKYISILNFTKYDENFNPEFFSLIIPNLSLKDLNNHVTTSIIYDWPNDYIKYLETMQRIDPNLILFAAGKAGRLDLYVHAHSRGATKFKHSLYWTCTGYFKEPDLKIKKENLVAIINYILVNNLIPDPEDVLLMAARGNHLELVEYAIDTLGAKDLYEALLGASFEGHKEIMWHLIVDRGVSGDMKKVINYYNRIYIDSYRYYPYSVKVMLGFPEIDPEAVVTSMEPIA